MKRLSSEEKMEAVRRRIECGESSRSIAQSLGVGKTSVDDWCRQYESMGSDAFSKKKNRKYSFEFKQAAVQFYLNGKVSTNETCKMFQIPTTSMLRQWIKMYNSHELKASPGGKVNMTKTKGRKTTLRERIDIVTDCFLQVIIPKSCIQKWRKLHLHFGENCRLSGRVAKALHRQHCRHITDSVIAL